jgi:hypothetical protein
MGAAAPVGPLAPLQLLALADLDPLDRLLGDLQRADDLPVQHARAPGGDGAHGQLLVPRHAELADDEHVERRSKPERDRQRDRQPPAGQGQHQHVLRALVFRQLVRQEPAGFGPVVEALCHGLTRAGRRIDIGGLRGPAFAYRIAPAKRRTTGNTGRVSVCRLHASARSVANDGNNVISKWCETDRFSGLRQARWRAKGSGRSRRTLLGPSFLQPLIRLDAHSRGYVETRIYGA